MARTSSRPWAIGAVTLGFVACGGTSTLTRGVPSGDDDSDVGTGGTSAAASKSGSAGRAGTSAQGGSTVGKGGASTRGGAAGKAGSGGKGGRSGQGGVGALGGASGTGGSSGTAGDAGMPAIDPNCQCTTDARSFTCWRTDVPVPAGFADPLACMAPDTR